VPLIPTDRCAVQFGGPWNTHFVSDVSAMDLHSLNADAEVVGDLPSRMAMA
jgi:hypothetical protein